MLNFISIFLYFCDDHVIAVLKYIIFIDVNICISLELHQLGCKAWFLLTSSWIQSKNIFIRIFMPVFIWAIVLLFFAVVIVSLYTFNILRIVVSYFWINLDVLVFLLFKSGRIWVWFCPVTGFCFLDESVLLLQFHCLQWPHFLVSIFYINHLSLL